MQRDELVGHGGKGCMLCTLCPNFFAWRAAKSVQRLRRHVAKRVHGAETVSLAAMNYVMELQEFPDGVELSPTDKAIAFVLAHHHNPEHRTTYPNRTTIARGACCCESTVKLRLAAMERHLLIYRLHPENQGRGQLTKYFFLALDAPDLLERLLLGEELQEGAEFHPLFSFGERGQKGVKSGAKRGQKGAKAATCNKERTRTNGNLELTTTTNHDVEISHIDHELLRGRLSEWLGIDNGCTRKVEVDDAVLRRLVERCTAADPMASTDDILHFINQKGPCLLEKRVTDGGYIYLQKAGIQYPAMFVVAAVASCFDGPNSASRRRRREGMASNVIQA